MKPNYKNRVPEGMVYSCITGADKQALLLESLRVLKKGGQFTIHDIMSGSRYGDMQAFAEKLKGTDYEKVEMIDTTDGLFMSKSEPRALMLSGLSLLMGTKQEDAR